MHSCREIDLISRLAGRTGWNREKMPILHGKKQNRSRFVDQIHELSAIRLHRGETVNCKGEWEDPEVASVILILPESAIDFKMSRRNHLQLAPHPSGA